VRSGWLSAFLKDPATIGQVLIVPSGGHDLVPMPDLDGRFAVAAWRAFTGSDCNPCKNAARLLGPATSAVSGDGATVRLVWLNRLRYPDGAMASIELEVNDGPTMTATWTITPSGPVGQRL
jgi:hypothetical protein